MTEYGDCSFKLTEYTGAELARKIEGLLTEMGMLRSLKGYRCLCVAIAQVYSEPNAIYNVMDGLYSQVAVETGTTASCVERNCRTAIKFLWENGNPEMLERYFFITDREAPTVREFVALIAERLRRNLIDGSVNGTCGEYHD